MSSAVSPSFYQTMGRVYRAWQMLGEALHYITSPIVLAVLFYGVITPMGWLMRAAGKELLSLKLDATASSYWVKRDDEQSVAGNMNHQF